MSLCFRSFNTRHGGYDSPSLAESTFPYADTETRENDDVLYANCSVMSDSSGYGKRVFKLETSPRKLLSSSNSQNGNTATRTFNKDTKQDHFHSGSSLDTSSAGDLSSTNSSDEHDAPCSSSDGAVEVALPFTSCAVVRDCTRPDDPLTAGTSDKKMCGEQQCLYSGGVLLHSQHHLQYYYHCTQHTMPPAIQRDLLIAASSPAAND